MKQKLPAKWNDLRVCLTSLFVLCLTNLSAQQRYFAISMVNENDNPALETIQGAKDVGCNAVALTVQWGAIEGKISRILKQEQGESYNVWKQYDDQISLALSLGMKIGLNIAVSSGDDATNSSSDRYGIDTGDGWLKQDRMIVINHAGDGAVFQKQGGPIRPGLNLQFVMTSLAAQSTRNRITDFTTKVMQRYKYLQDGNNLLYVNLIFSRSGEGEFEIGSTKFHFDQQLDMSDALTDYSVPMISAFRQWLTGKYGTIAYLNSKWGSNYSSFNNVNPKIPSGSTFTGADGSDWFLFRTHILKEANQLFKNAVKGVDPNIKVITHHGSVYDKLSKIRGTLPFNEIGADLDGIKINDDIDYDHRFALDLIRTNLPGKLYVNEAAYYEGGVGNVVNLAEESFRHGANVVTVFHLDNALNSPTAVTALKNLTDNWVKDKQVSKPSASNTDHFTLSSMINANGCLTNRDSYSNDCDAYKNWRGAFNAANNPVNIYLTDDITTPGCFYKNLKPSNNNDQASAIIPNNQFYHLTAPDCRVIGTVKGADLTNGTTPFTASVDIDPTVASYNSQPYVQRHFEFVPGGTNPSQATLTVYVSQDEFTAFNTVSSVKLPKNAGDSDNAKDNIRIWQWHGTPLSGAADATIDPDDSNIQWDSVLGLWKITFAVNGFSSFFVTAANATALPVTLVNFNARKVENSTALTWQTSDETNSDHFEIQRSHEGKQWSEIGNVSSSRESKVLTSYSFTDETPVSGDNLYRLKMIDQDGTFAYSRIVSLGFEGMEKIILFPNPVVSGMIRLNFTGTLPEISLFDVTGKLIPTDTEQIGQSGLLVKPETKLPAGLYILTTGSGLKQVRHKVAVMN
ncbi:T9SS type A sorting domain-containing protein [Dyadobacter arcticus]|uniref:Glycoside hydrolase family 42 N-terminal domain-containing protein n=1 Tax=Dyadobacter arcticus TaxID=1078754 RepID=A0ABX0ULH0_9BACT|nr:T9SS type A sorting domain-containing protein [Dyadobacter arcticus]NIJ51951.1 hypothetical protein [Dyadobacter arcticus]